MTGETTLVDVVVVPIVDALARDVDLLAVSESLVFVGDTASSPA